VPDDLPWPPRLRGHSPLLVVPLLGWLGGGLFAITVALVTGARTDLAYGMTHAAAASVGLLLLVVAGPRAVSGRRRRAAGPLAEPVPVRVPAQDPPSHDDRHSPALT
jgi:peptidoglycan/LPS O-acetylase OafA/YrhL